MLKGAIFDFDGTLFDSMFIWDTIGEAYLRSIGYEPKENLNEVFKTFSLYQAACYYQSEYGVTWSMDEIMTGDTYGCTLSSAIGANLAKEFTLSESVQRVKDYISCALSAMLDLGKSSGPMQHNFDSQGEFAKEAE